MNKRTATKIVLAAALALIVSGCATKGSYMRLDPRLQSDVRKIGGFQYVPLTRVCDAYGIECKWDPIVRTATIRDRCGTVVLREGSDRALMNGVMKRLDRPVVSYNGTVYISVSFARSGLVPQAAYAPIAAPAPSVPEVAAAKKFSIKTVVLDTGHGGKDIGAMGRKAGTKEKDAALELSGRVKSMLESKGIRVIMTRSSDVFIPLEKRVDIANRSGADIFVSVHLNASRSKSLRGFECYYLSNATDDNARALEAFEDSSLKLTDGADAMRSSQLDKTLWDMALTENRIESGELAGFICKSVEEGYFIKNRGVRTARFYVLKHTRMPAVLVEAGYISNPIEESMVSGPHFTDTMAEAITRGILRYKDKYERTEGFTDV